MSLGKTEIYEQIKRTPHHARIWSDFIRNMQRKRYNYEKGTAFSQETWKNPFY